MLSRVSLDNDENVKGKLCCCEPVDMAQVYSLTLKLDLRDGEERRR